MPVAGRGQGRPGHSSNQDRIRPWLPRRSVLDNQPIILTETTLFQLEIFRQGESLAVLVGCRRAAIFGLLQRVSNLNKGRKNGGQFLLCASALKFFSLCQVVEALHFNLYSSFVPPTRRDARGSSFRSRSHEGDSICSRR